LDTWLNKNEQQKGGHVFVTKMAILAISGPAVCGGLPSMSIGLNREGDTTHIPEFALPTSGLSGVLEKTLGLLQIIPLELGFTHQLGASDSSPNERVQVIGCYPAVIPHKNSKGFFRVTRIFRFGEEDVAILEIFGEYGPKGMSGFPSIKGYEAQWIMSPDKDFPYAQLIYEYANRVLENKNSIGGMLNLGWPRQIQVQP